MSPYHRNPHCFCCGDENPASFGMTVSGVGERLIGDATFDHRHEGARGNLHGGAILAVLDEILGDLATHLARPAVTASMTVDFRAPVPLPASAELSAWCEEAEGRKLRLRAEMRVAGRLVAEARGLLVEPR